MKGRTIMSISMETCYQWYIQTDHLLQDVEQQYNTLCQLLAIQDTIRTYGSSEALEFLYRGNDIDFTVEGLGEKIKEGVKSLFERIMKLLRTIGTFIKNLFQKKKVSEADVNKKATAVIEKVKRRKITPPSKSSLREPIIEPGVTEKVCKHLTISNINKWVSEYKQKVFSKITAEELRSLTEDKTRELARVAVVLNDDLSAISSYGRIEEDAKAIDEEFCKEAPTIVKACNDLIVEHEQRIDTLEKMAQRMYSLAEKNQNDNIYEQAVTLSGNLNIIATQIRNTTARLLWVTKLVEKALDSVH